MNEQQNIGAGSPGRRDFPSASPGGNSPVLGGRTPDLDRAAYATSAAGSERHAELPHRMVTPRDETIRAGEHRYRTPMPERHQDNTLPIVAASMAGGAALVWFLSKLVPSRREHDWEREDRYPRYGASREYETVGARRSGTQYGSSSGSVATDETWDLIASDKVEGTAVYDRNGERLGSVYNFMVGKRSGRVAYAVMSFGGWLGMGESYHPLPWNTLTYDTDRGGYVVTLSKDRLRQAPSHKAGHDTSDASYWRQVKDYWA